MNARIGTDERPIVAAVVRAIEPRLPFSGVYQCVHAATIRARNCETHSSPLAYWQSIARDLFPSQPAVGGFVQSTPGPADRRICTPRRPARLPQRGKNDLRISWIQRHINGAGVLVFVQNFLPGGAPIGGAKYAALWVGSIGVAQRGDQNHAGVARIDDNASDLPRIAQADVFPGEATVDGFINAVPESD